MVTILSKFIVLYLSSYFVVYFLKLEFIFFYNRIVYYYTRIFLIWLPHKKPVLLTLTKIMQLAHLDVHFFFFLININNTNHKTSFI